MNTVMVFEHKDYAGLSQEFGPGTYLTTTLALGADKISSIKVPPGWKVVLWADDKLVGASKFVTTDIADLTTIGFNETVASMTITCPASEASRDVAATLGFNGVDTHIQAGPIALDFTGGSFQGLTIEAWVRFDSTGTWARILEMYDTVTGDNIYLGRRAAENTLQFSARLGQNSWLDVLVPNAIDNGKWAHFAAVVGIDGTVKVVRNGAVVGSGKISVPNNISRNTLYIGRSAFSAHAYFAGQMSEMRLWGYARSDVEINRTKSTRLTGSEKGLLRYYPLDETSSAGSVAKDGSGNKNGTISGTATYRLSGPSLGTAPGFTTGMQFDGANDYVALPALEADLSKGFSLEAWVFYDGLGNAERIFDLGNGAPADNIVFGRSGTTNELTLEVYRGTSLQKLTTASSVLVANTWLHIAATVDTNGNAAIYVNGVPRAAGVGFAPNASVILTKAYLGKNNWSGMVPFKGRLADVRLWMVARTADEINRVMHGRLDTSEIGLLAYYPMTEIGDTVVHDASPSRLHGSVFPALLWNQTAPTALTPAGIPADTIIAAPPSVRGSMSFDGVDDYVALPAVGGDYSQGLTIEAWVYFDGVLDGARMCDFGNGPAADNIILGRSGTSNELTLEVWQSGTKKALTTTDSVIMDQTWMHVAANVDNTGLAKIYVNGVEKTSAQLWTPRAGITRTQSFLGKGNSGSPSAFKGRLADVRLWTIFRNASEIAATMSTALVGNEPGLFRYYPLDDASGTPVRDLVRRDGTIWGAEPWPSLPHRTTLEFGGTYLDLGPLTMNLAMPFTIEAWVYFESEGSYGRIFDFGNGQASDNILLARSGTSNDLTLHIYRGGSLDVTLTTVGVLELNKWKHIAVTLGACTSDNTAVISIYVDGQKQAAERKVLPNNIARTKSYFGKSNWSANPNFVGRMSDLRIWTTTRSRAEIQSAMYTPLNGTEAGLFRYYKLDDGPGPVARDSTGRANATVVAYNRSAMRFDGVADYVQMPAFTADFSSGFTLEAWVYFDSREYWSRIVDIGQGQSDDNILFARVANNATLALDVYVGGTRSELTAALPNDVGRWIHVAATLDSTGKAIIYIDGVQAATGTISKPAAGLTRSLAYIGKSNWAGDALFKGRMAEVRIWSTPRTQAQIQALMHTSATGSEGGLVRYYKLTDAPGTVAKDSVLNAPANATVFCGNTRAHLSFDGVANHLALQPVSAEFSNGFTLEAWVYFEGRQNWARIVDIGQGQSNDNIHFGRNGVSASLAFDVYVGGTKYELTAPLQNDVGRWIHVAATLESTGKATIYIDGVQASTNTMPRPTSSLVRPFAYIGKSNWAADELFKGRMAEVRIWTIARTQAQIQAQINMSLVGNETGLYAYFKLDEAPAIAAKNSASAWPHGAMIGGRAAACWDNRPDADSQLFGDGGTYVELPAFADDFSQGVTLEAWVYVAGIPAADETFIDIGNKNASDNITLARSGTSKDLVLRLVGLGSGDTSGPVSELIAVDLLRNETWMHLCGTIGSSGNARIYVNGIVMKSGTVSKPRGGIVRAMGAIGRRLETTTYFRGRMSEVRIWNRERTAEEVTNGLSVRMKGTESGLVRYYPLNTGAGLVARDNIVHDAATAAGTPKRFSLPLGGWPPAVPTRGALEFDGVDDYVALPMVKADFSRGFTIEAWVYFNGLGAQGWAICDLGNGPKADNLWFGQVNGTNALALEVWRGDEVQRLTTGSGAITNMTWIHVAATVDEQGVANIYVDGGLKKSATLWTPRAGVCRNNAYVGRNNLFDQSLFKGRMADVRIWNRARTATEVANGRNTGLSRDDTRLVAYYRLDETSGNVAHDASNATQHATVMGQKRVWGAIAPQFVPPPYATGCLAFDGANDYVVLPTIHADLSKAFTLEAWVYFANTTPGGPLIHLGNGLSASAASNDILLWRNPAATNDLLLHVYQDASQVVTLNVPSVLSPNTWMHVAVVLSGFSATDNKADYTIYINGVVKASMRGLAPNNVARSKCYIGKCHWDAVSYEGSMAEVRIWSVARSIDQIKRACKARLLGSETGLVANYRLNDDAGERVADASMFGRHASLRGRATWNAPSPDFVTAANQTGVLRLGGTGANYVELQALEATRALTLEAWISCNDVTKTASFIEVGNASSDRVYLGHENNDLVFGMQLGSGTVQKVILPDVLVNTTWTHVSASVDDNGLIVLCKDGIPLKYGVTTSSNIATLPSSVARNLGFIGRDIANVAKFQGSMSEVRIWSIARTPKQINEAKMVRLGGAMSGLARCYPLVAVVGTTATDTSAAGKHGTVKGSAILWNVTEYELSGTLPPTSAPATNPGALVFDGASTYAQLPAIVANLSTGLTIEAWVCFESTSSNSWERIVDIGVGQATDNVYVSRYVTTNQIVVRIYNGANYTEAYTTNDVIVAGQWIHVAVTQDSNRAVAIYINGISQALTKRNQPPTATSNFTPAAGTTRSLCFIGKSSWSADALFKGRMAEVRLWSLARSATEITTTMNNRLHGEEAGLVVAHRFTETMGNVAASVCPGQAFTNIRGNVVWDKGTAASYPVWDLVIVVDDLVPYQPVPTEPPPTGTPVALSAVPLEVSDKMAEYRTGVTLDLFGTTCTITMSASASVAIVGKVYLIAATFTVTIGSDNYPVPDAILCIQPRDDKKVVGALRVPLSNSLLMTKLKSIVGNTPVVSTVMNPFMDILSTSTLLMATGAGTDPNYGPFTNGVTIFSDQIMSDLPVLSSIHDVFPELGLDTRHLLLSLGLSSEDDVRASGTARIDSTLINTSSVRLTFDEMGLDVGTKDRTQIEFGVRHKFTLVLLDETLVFKGGVKLLASGVLEFWGALCREGDDGGVWRHPWGIPGIDIGEFGVQIALAKPISIGARGEVHIGNGLLGGTIALNMDPLVLIIDCPEGIPLVNLINAFMDGTDIPKMEWLDSVFDIHLKDLKLYYVPVRATIAGKEYQKGKGVSATLSLWGWDAKVEGQFGKVAGYLKGNADRLIVAIAGVSLLEFTDATGNEGPMVDISIALSRQNMEFSGRFRFLDGLVEKEGKCLAGPSGIDYKTETPGPVGTIKFTYKEGCLNLIWSPRITYGFRVSGLFVGIEVGVSIANFVDRSRYVQTLSCWFNVCGKEYRAGPVSWDLPFTSLSMVGEGFEILFGDMVKSLFKDMLAQALEAAFDWVKNNVTDLAEDAVELFKSAGASIANIAKNVYATFDVAAHELIGYLEVNINEAAGILKDALNLTVTEAAKTLGAAFNEGSAAVKDALGTAYTNVADVSDNVWDTIDDAAGYLDPTGWS